MTLAKSVIKNSRLKNELSAHVFGNGTFEQWKIAKKNVFNSLYAAPQIEFDGLKKCPIDSIKKIKQRCALTNFALYQVSDLAQTPEDCAADLMSFAQALGMAVPEDHRSAGENSIVALTPDSEKSKQGYIPYTPRALNWHTDGYYNPAEAPIKAFLLHCFRPAEHGGTNELIDPEIAFMRLFEADPALVDAFFHPKAMTIPANVEKDGSVRPPSVGPVFFFDDRTKRLQMRYTARTRSIEWRDDPATRDAAQWMQEWLASDEPYKVRIKLKAGQGIVNNNVLHNRTEFKDDPNGLQHRVMLRVRFHDRVGEI